ncbi:MAG: hypothetical protein H0W43_10400 [Chthoniobacterales bacterium]|nr:hypothetical protein [Chthoniobacterales bacterium]
MKRRGVTVPDGWHLSVANVISADGQTIYGWGFNPNHLIEMYKVVLNAPATSPAPGARLTIARRGVA